MLIDVFNGDPFTTVSLTKGILKAPYKPTRIGKLGLFRESGVSTTSIIIEEKDGQLSLVQTSPRGGVDSTGPGPLVGAKRTARSFLARHLERESMILADQVQNVRTFGSDNTQDAVQAVVDQRLATLRAMLEVTLEFHRIGAIRGEILDADGSVLTNLFDEFEVTQQTANIDVDVATETAVRENVVAAVRLIEDELGAEPVSSYRAFCSAGFFDGLISSKTVKESLKYQESALLRGDLRNGFEFGGVTWEEYRGNVSGQAFIDANKAYLFPEGTDIFQTYFAPADFIEAVNTLGLPMYAKIAVDDQLQRWAKVHAQSNPLAINLRPRAVVKLSLT